MFAAISSTQSRWLPSSCRSETRRDFHVTVGSRLFVSGLPPGKSPHWAATVSAADWSSALQLPPPAKTRENLLLFAEHARGGDPDVDHEFAFDTHLISLGGDGLFDVGHASRSATASTRDGARREGHHPRVLAVLDSSTRAPSTRCRTALAPARSGTTALSTPVSLPRRCRRCTLAVLVRDSGEHGLDHGPRRETVRTFESVREVRWFRAYGWPRGGGPSRRAAWVRIRSAARRARPNSPGLGRFWNRLRISPGPGRPVFGLRFASRRHS